MSAGDPGGLEGKEGRMGNRRSVGSGGGGGGGAGGSMDEEMYPCLSVAPKHVLINR